METEQRSYFSIFDSLESCPFGGTLKLLYHQHIYGIIKFRTSNICNRAHRKSSCASLHFNDMICLACRCHFVIIIDKVEHSMWTKSDWNRHLHGICQDGVYCLLPCFGNNRCSYVFFFKKNLYRLVSLFCVQGHFF